MHPFLLCLFAATHVAVCRAEDGEIKLQGPKGPIWELAACDDWIAARSEAGRNVMLWRLPDGFRSYRLEPPNGERPNRLLFSPDGRELCISYETCFRIWRLVPTPRFREFPANESQLSDFIWQISDYSADGRTLLKWHPQRLTLLDRDDPRVVKGIVRFFDESPPLLLHPRFLNESNEIGCFVEAGRSRGETWYALRRVDANGRTHDSDIFKTGWAPWGLGVISEEKVLATSAETSLLWNPKSNRMQRNALPHDGTLQFAMERESKLIAYVSKQDEIIVLNGKSLAWQVIAAKDPVWSVAYSAKHSVLAIGYGNPFAPGDANRGIVGLRKVLVNVGAKKD